MSNGVEIGKCTIHHILNLNSLKKGFITSCIRTLKKFFDRKLPSELKLIVGLARWLRIDINKNNKIGVIKMDKLAAKIYLTGKILELGKTLIYKTEIVAKGKAGAEKFKQVYEGFWDKLEELLEKEKSIDRKWIPDFVEEIGEEVLTEVLKEARKTFDLKVILQQIFDEEKAGNKNIL